MTTTSPVTSALPQAAASTATNTAASSATAPALDENAFLKLLMAQMQNQDPLAPTDSTQFVTQLAQFTQVQQTTAQSTTLTQIATQLSSMGNSQATNLIGKTVTMQGNGLQWDGSFATSANVTLAAAAQSISATVTDSQGNVVRTMTLPAQPAGPLGITWDGHEDSGQLAPAGSYSVNVTATDANGQTVNVSQTTTGVVTQVGLSGGSPTLTLSTGAVAPVSQLVDVASSAGATPTTP